MIGERSIRNFEDIRTLAFGFRASRVLLTALDLDLFTVMGARRWRARTLANTLRVSERGLEILCRNLASLGLLNKAATGYRSHAVAQRYLNAKSEEYRGAYLRLLQEQWQDWTRLTDAVRTGRPVDDGTPEPADYRRSFTWAMHQRSLEPSKQVAQQLNLRKATSLLDLGGGPGTYALAFLKRNPQLRATLYDRPAALEVARDIARPLRHGRRLSYQTGDFLRDRITGLYDVIWVSNVIHIYSPATNMKIFKKLRRLAAPGGCILIQDTFLSGAQGLTPVETNLFAVTMLLFTEEGNTYHQRDVKQWLADTGWERVQRVKLASGTGDWEGELVKARCPRT